MGTFSEEAAELASQSASAVYSPLCTSLHVRRGQSDYTLCSVIWKRCGEPAIWSLRLHLSVVKVQETDNKPASKRGGLKNEQYKREAEDVEEL